MKAGKIIIISTPTYRESWINKMLEQNPDITKNTPWQAHIGDTNADICNKPKPHRGGKVFVGDEPEES